MRGGDEEEGALLRDIPGASRPVTLVRCEVGTVADRYGGGDVYAPDLAEEDVEDGKPPEDDEQVDW